MKVNVETKLTPVMTVYDSSAQAQGGGAGRALMRFLDPVVAVTADDGTVLYKTGEFYDSYFPYIAGGLGLAAGILVFWLLLGRD